MELYLENEYAKEFEARVLSVKDGKYVVLDKTAFYPRGGGQPCDTGVLEKDGVEYKVLFVGKFDGVVSHEVDRGGLKENDVVKGRINWSDRYMHMRYHTASHILSSLLYGELGAKITGNQIYSDKLRVDFNLEDFDKDLLKSYIEKTNEQINKGLEVKKYELDRSEAGKDESLVKLAGALPPSVGKLRIVEIGDVDKQADGGTHVKNTREIGELEFLKAENKGKNNRRLYVKLKG